MADDWFTSLRNGRQHPVQLLLGSNQDEGTFPVFNVPDGTAAEFVARSAQRYGREAAAFQALYPARTEAESTTSQLAAFRDLVFWNLSAWARLQAADSRSKAFLYYFTREPPARQGERSRGASHTAEIPYPFNNLHVEKDRPWTDADRRLADTMSSYWANFAATGDPNGSGLPSWPSYDGRGGATVMILGERTAAGPAPNQAGLDLYDRIFSAVPQRGTR